MAKGYISNRQKNLSLGIVSYTENQEVLSVIGKVGIGTRIDITPYDTLSDGTLSFEGSAGQLFSITNNLTSGSIFSVNDVSGIPSIDVDADGTVQLAPFGASEYVGIGTTNPTAKLDVNGTAKATLFVGSGASLTNIPNGALDNSTVSYGGVQLSLGGSDATPAFDLSDATNYPYTSITGITTNIVGDTTPQLGGDLDVNGNDITGTGNINLTGVITATSFDGSLATTNLTGTITNAQLAGSIDNSKLSNSTVSYGGVLLSLGGSDATPAFDLSDATNYPYSSLTGITTDILGDTTPQLGGNLDLNGNDITGTGNISITGNLNVSGVSTFQGNVNLGDDDRLRLGDGNDLQIFHNGSNSYIEDSGTGALIFKSNVYSFRNAADTEDIAKFTQNGAVELYYDNSKKFETTGYGVTVSGGLNVSGVSTFQGNVNLGDNDILRFGDGQDLQIYHTGSNSIIQDTGDGDLFLSGDSVVRITNSAFTETKALFTTNGSVELYYDNSKKFETTTTGIEVSNGASTSATIAGPDEIIIDPATVGDNTGSVRIKGDLFVDGTTTQINSTTIELADFIVGIATTATTDTLADGAGIQIGPDNTFLYEYNSGTNPSLKSSENLNVASGKHYQIGETEVLNATTLGSGVVNSSLTSVGTLTGLTVSGDVSIADKIVHTGDTNTAIRFPAADTFTVETAGSERLRINSSGNVGIGTDTPVALLHVQQSADGEIFRVQRTGGTNLPILRFNLTEATPDAEIEQTGAVAGAIGFKVGATRRMTIASNGNIGIGTDNPSELLDVNGDARFRGAIYDNNNVVGTANSVLTSTGSGVVWAQAGVQVSVGTEAPTSPSQGELWYNSEIGRTFVYYQDGTSNQWVDSAPFYQNEEEPVLTAGKTSSSFTATEGQTTFTFSYEVGYIEVYLNGVRLSVGEYTASNGTSFTLSTGASEGDVVDVVEYIVGIGATGSGGPIENIAEKTDSATYYPIFTTGVGSTLPYITTTSDYFEFTPSTGTLDVNNLTTGNSIVVGSAVTITSSEIDITGGITASGIITATDFNSTSDIALKTNITQIDNPIDKISQINGVSFDWKETQRPSAGVIAQDVEKVLPQLVNGEDTKTVNYNGLIGVLIEAVKEQQEQINTLKEEIAKLKG